MKNSRRSVYILRRRATPSINIGRIKRITLCNCRSDRRERERASETESESETKTETENESERKRDRDRDRERETETETETESKSETETETETETESERESESERKKKAGNLTNDNAIKREQIRGGIDRSIAKLDTIFHLERDESNLEILSLECNANFPFPSLLCFYPKRP